MSRAPAVVVFDVNETLSDMSPMAGRFEDVGAPTHLAAAWFAGLLRDGFALTVAGSSQPFAHIGAEALRVSLQGVPLTESLDDAVTHIMDGFQQLDVHPDVPAGVRALADLGIQLVTLSNGSASVAERLLEQAGVRDRFAHLLSVESAGTWKPARGAYAYALERCKVDPMDALLVAVHPWDTDGASRAGLGSAWINRGGGTYPGHFTPPDLEARSLVELADQLR
ncbi:MAG: Putative FMN hydrolase; 5-Amino-6-(5'-phosphoribitylamino)uracil phosphatase [uncultured Nocardioidaceae bacterium]|uniref:FMN hydrolase 5-Amino-6-(5'-phosphoribitylamino)uracil phosphatase n=1 Tax=uncultured Nocardioidaceae bacterium TaxID=253824 RepID=A0A6J4MR68_9ACTN|nr:MAG: Putative FMN hydrolase; 5-Amino-6-(5'-phosphoribitylamino)uracil phosphatase [uncultured Nocardioidaceae bacterium]